MLILGYHNDRVTNDHEIGWGTSFHFAPMFKDSTFAQVKEKKGSFFFDFFFESI